MQAFLPILSYLLPLVGKMLLMIPFVPNKLIPFILGALNIAQKWWVLLGWPTATAAVSGVASQTHLAFIIPAGAVSVIWGTLEQFLFHNWYEHQKATAAAKGETSWWSKNSSDLWKKQS